jgi:hypothetical protein
MTGVHEHGQVRAGHERKQMLGEYRGWFDLVVVAREHQDRDVDVTETGGDIQRQTVFRPGQASLLAGPQTVFDDPSAKHVGKWPMGQRLIDALLHGLLVVVGVHRQLLQLLGGTDRRGGCRRNEH